MVEGKEWKTVFYYQYGLFKFRIIPISLINALIIFQIIINHILYNLLNNGVLIYINNILIYIKIIKEYD